MSKRQRVILWVGVAVFVLMGLFPPWYVDSLRTYGFLFWPPDAGRWTDGYVRCPWRIDTDRLYVQWVLVAGLTASMLLAVGRRVNPP